MQGRFVAVLGLRHANKILQVGKGQVGAQTACGRLKVGGIILRTPLEAFVFGHDGHLHATVICVRHCFTQPASLAISPKTSGLAWPAAPASCAARLEVIGATTIRMSPPKIVPSCSPQ